MGGSTLWQVCNKGNPAPVTALETSTPEGRDSGLPRQLPPISKWSEKGAWDSQESMDRTLALSGLPDCRQDPKNQEALAKAIEAKCRYQGPLEDMALKAARPKAFVSSRSSVLAEQTQLQFFDH